jgi:pentatricopeptide repeat protein
MAQLSLLDRVLGQTIRELTVALLLRGSGTVSSGPDTDALLSELLAVWKLAFQCRAEDSTTVQAIDEHWHLPADAERRSLTEPRDFTERFAKYLKGAQNYHSMADSAIALFSILKANSGYGIEINQSLRDQAAPLVHFLAGMVCNADMRRTLYLHERSMAPYREDLPIKYQQLLVEDISSAPLEGSILATKADGNQEEQLLKRISRAVQEHTHKDRLARLWQEVLGIYTTGESRTTIPVPIYNAFLSGFLELYAGDASLQVWNHMIAQGVKPDVTSWTALLSGCGKARDLDGLNIMWERMMRSGVQPDVYAWTARIHGLISLRQITAGFAAMDEMGRRWLASAQSSSAAEQISKKKQGRTDSGFEAPKPTTEVVNGAISAVADIGNMPFSRKTEHAHKILRWAGSLSIPPDARTYNILIQIYLRGQDLATALNLLEQMERDGLEPDIVTYTMLIGASFDNQEFHGLSPPEQTARVTELFSRLEARGLKLNSWTYSSTIDKLLKRHGNMSAVRVIVDHMMSRGISPTVHIYTSLITYYFQQSPPDIESVDSLWFQLNERPGAVADRVLFDRIVEGYASVGEIGKMMAVLTKMSALGKLPSWVTLTAVVKALVAAGEWERARGVVRDVQNGEGVAKGGMRVPTHGMQEFRSTVYKYGLVDSDLELEGPTGHGGIGGESGFSGVQG